MLTFVVRVGSVRENPGPDCFMPLSRPGTIHVSAAINSSRLVGLFIRAVWLTAAVFAWGSVATTPALAAVGDITTVAGDGSIGFSGDGGPAASAILNNPKGIVIDATGNLFIADDGNNRVRRIDAATGIITTVVGIGSAGFSGDGGPAVNAELVGPTDVAFDTSGNLLIADSNNKRIRSVDAATGIITTVAGDGGVGFSGDGGPATSASIGIPFGITVDADGNFFIAEVSSNRIRRVDAATGVISTVAGDGSSGFSGDGGIATDSSLNFPTDVTVDAVGNLLIADAFNNRIRRVETSTGIITTIAGDGAFAFSGDGGLATSASLANAFGFAVDASGNIFIVDSNNNRIRRVDVTTGIISTVAGDGGSGFSGDGGPATGASIGFPFSVVVDAAGNLLIASDHRVRRVQGIAAVASSPDPVPIPGVNGWGLAVLGAALLALFVRRAFGLRLATR